ncbi:MAG TPA: UDP-N-acetylmuramate dehydrogenase [Candidatus Omnitrophota bacterium]|nr:UDP-N-acetylmuramate dehydrogenase [Candidatus Omnitrophota bacterium]
MNIPPEWNGLVSEQELLSRHSTFRIGGPARFFSQPKTLTELETLLRCAKREGIPFVLIGNGSNVLFSDQPFEGLVVSLAGYEPDLFEVNGNEVRVSAGMNLPRLALLLAQHSLGGLEFTGTIPGTVGGALAMNAGYGRTDGKPNQVGDFIKWVKVLPGEGNAEELGRAAIRFDYRSSSLAGKIILEACFELTKKPREDILRQIRESQDYRAVSQDLQHPSAGSVFKNPAGSELSAGKMIDLAGLRGFQIGRARISDKHANFIVNLGGSTAVEVLSLVSIARETVKRKFGVELELEIKYVSNETPAYAG